jgi:hypothetical protein
MTVFMTCYLFLNSESQVIQTVIKMCCNEYLLNFCMYYFFHKIFRRNHTYSVQKQCLGCLWWIMSVCKIRIQTFLPCPMGSKILKQSVINRVEIEVPKIKHINFTPPFYVNIWHSLPVIGLPVKSRDFTVRAGKSKSSKSLCRNISRRWRPLLRFFFLLFLE